MKCHKVGYSTKSEAKEAIKQIDYEKRKYSKKVKSAKNGRKMRVYNCPVCREWHITTQKQNKYSKRKGANEKHQVTV